MSDEMFSLIIVFNTSFLKSDGVLVTLLPSQIVFLPDFRVCQCFLPADPSDSASPRTEAGSGNRGESFVVRGYDARFSLLRHEIFVSFACRMVHYWVLVTQGQQDNSLACMFG